MFSLAIKAIVAGYHSFCGFIGWNPVLAVVGLALRLYADYRDWESQRQGANERVLEHNFWAKWHRCNQLYEQKQIAFVIMRGDEYFLVNRTAGELHGDAPELMYGRTLGNYSPELQPDGERSIDKARRLLLEAKQTRRLVRCPWDAELGDMTTISLQVHVLFVGTLETHDYFCVLMCVQEETIPEALMPQRLWGGVPEKPDVDRSVAESAGG